MLKNQKCVVGNVAFPVIERNSKKIERRQSVSQAGMAAEAEAAEVGERKWDKDICMAYFAFRHSYVVFVFIRGCFFICFIGVGVRL